MNRLVRGLVVGTLIGSAVGMAMLMRRRQTMIGMRQQAEQATRRTRGTIKMVRDKAKRWTSAVKTGTEAFSDRLAQHP